MKLSVIIPTYYSEDTIIQTLDSIYSLQMQEDSFEVIIVDGCSKDNTINLIKSFQSQHDNIVLLEQEVDHKLGAARNWGLKVARGEYITFVDSDDEVAVGLLSALDQAMVQKVDVQFCHYCYLKNGVKKEVSLQNDPKLPINGRAFINAHNDDWFLARNSWANLYKREYLQKVNIPFAEDVFFEDADWVIQHLYYADTIRHCQDITYIYKYRAGSALTGSLNWFRAASKILEGYRELLFAEKIKDSDAQTYIRLVADAQYKIEGQMRRLWKIAGGDFGAFYNKVDLAAFEYLSSHYRWSRRVNFMLAHPKITVHLLNIIARPLLMAKKIKNEL